MCLFIYLFICFSNFAAVENKYSGLGIPEIKFSGRAHAENKYSVPTKCTSPHPIRIKMVAPTLNKSTKGCSKFNVKKPNEQNII